MIEGYEAREDRELGIIYIHKATGAILTSELEALRDFYNRICKYANSKMTGHDIHDTIRSS